MDLEDLEVLQIAEQLADSLWNEVSQWDGFAKETLGKQLARSADSIGANIAEAFGRYHFGEKLKFFYYSRGSIYESKYWLNRAMRRGLLDEENVKRYLANLTRLAKRLNALVSTTKNQQSSSSDKSIKEIPPIYLEELVANELFSANEIKYLATIPQIET